MRPAAANLSAAVALSGLVVATAVTFDSLLSGETIPAYRDLLFFTLPLKAFLAEHIARGALPLWNPLLLMGTPFLGNLQSGVFYPPSALLLFPLPLGFNLFLFAHYVIALTGMWAWLRDRELSVLAASVGASVFTLGGYLVSVLNLTNHLQSAAWAPWVLFCWARYVRTRSPRAFLGFVAMVCLQLLGGSPESLLMTLIVAAAWTAYVRLPSVIDTLGLAAAMAAALLLVVGICAIQVLPTLECVSQSDRSGAMSFAEVMRWPLRPVALLQLLFPHSSAMLPPSEANSLGPGFERTLALIQSPYLGIGGLCLAIVGCARGHERALWGMLIAGAVLLALGDQTPILPWLYRELPWLFGKFRYPEKFYFVVHLGAAVLAAEGAERLTRGDHAAERIAWISLATLLVVVAPLYVMRWWWPLEYLRALAILSGKYLPLSVFVPLALDTYWKAQRLMLIVAGLATVPLLRRGVLGHATAGASIAMLVVVDLVSVNRNLNLASRWADLDHRPLLIDAARAKESGERIFNYQTVPASGAVGGSEQRLTRWLHTIESSQDLSEVYRRLWETAYTNGGMLYGIANASGGDGLARDSDRLLLETLLRVPIERGIALLRIYGVGYLTGPDALTATELQEIPADHVTPYRAYRIADPLPLVHAVSRLHLAASAAEAMIRMTDPGFDPREEAFVDEPPAGWRDLPRDAAASVQVTIMRRTNESLKLRAKSDAPTFLVVNESYFPGWEALVDGIPTRIHRANGIVRGLFVPSGAHTIDLSYRPWSFRLGAAISAGTLVLLLLLATRGSRLASRGSHPGEPR